MKKKNLVKGLALACGFGLCLAGCAPLAAITDKNGNNITFDSPVYYQGQVARVGDYVFYGNSYADVTASDFNYNAAAGKSYLARIDLSNLKFEDDVIDLNYKHSSPKGVEKVSDKLAGYANQQMFAYGEYLYFTSANIHKTTSMQNDFTRVSLFRIKFNGEGLEEIGTYKYDANSSITLQKGSDDNYYFVVICPSEAEATTEEAATTYDVYSVKVGAKMGASKQIVSKATSAVVGDENSTEKTVIYTAAAESETKVCAVKAIDFANENPTIYDSGLSKAVVLEGKIGDEVIYSYDGEIFYKDATAKGTFVPGASQLFYSAGDISDLTSIGGGYVFKGASSLVYKESLDAEATLIATSTEYSNMLFADGDYVYLSNASSIIRKNVTDKTSETLVEGMTIISGQCGYDGENVYFYANRGKLEEVEEQPTDSNYYLYQVDKNGNIQMLSNLV